MPALNESWWSNETSIGSGHPGLGGGSGEIVDIERPCGIDQPSALLLAFQVYVQCFSVYTLLSSLFVASLVLTTLQRCLALQPSAFSRENEMILVLAYYQSE